MDNQAQTEHKLEMVHIDTISVNPYQPRRSFEPESLEELAESIRSVGLIQPPVVRALGEGNYELVSGERRYRACQLAGLQTIPVIIQKVNTSRSAEAALVENVQRVDLNAIEIARALRRLMVDFGLTQDRVAERVGLKRSTVANYLRILTLPSEGHEALVNGKISMGHAKAILALESALKQKMLLDEVLAKSLSVRDTEKLAKKYLQPERIIPQIRKEKDIHLAYFQEMMQRKLGTKVMIQGTEEKGKITIDYYSLDDINRIFEIMEIRDDS